MTNVVSTMDRRPTTPSSAVVRVLVVDDDELDFLAVKRMLRKAEGPFEFEAVHAVSLEQGMTVLTTDRFDVVVVDYFLGSTCGLDLVRRLGGRNAKVPMIMLTGSRDPQVLGEIVDAGITNYLGKDSLDGALLRGLLLSAIEQHRTDVEMLQTSGILIDKSLRIPGLGYFDYQVDLDLLLWSRESYLIWGVVPGEFKPTIANVLTLVHPEDHVFVQQALAAGSDTSSVELRVLVKGGSERRILAVVNRGTDENGKVLRLHGIYHEVTALRLAEGRLQSQQRKYQQLFDNSDVSLWLVDCSAIFAAVHAELDNGRDILKRLKDDGKFCEDLRSWFKVTESNKAATQMFGFGGESPVNHSALLQKWIVGLVHDLAVGMVERASAVRSECIIETRRGERSAVFSFPVPTTPEEATSVPVTIIDLTDIHHAELANRANIAKSTFLAHMSHELRSPLNGIVASIDLLQGTPLNDEQDSLVSSAQSSADTLLHLIGDILDFSKIEAGRIELEQIDFDIQDIILNVDSMVQAKAAVEGVSFSWRIEGSVPLKVEGDPLRLKQVLLNLTANAIRHTTMGGVYLRVSAASGEEGRNILRFDVVDSGTGLDPQKSTHIFDAFVQAQGSSARTHGGTGLGLAIAKSIVDLWGGEIGLGGAVGEGAHFWFTMPVRVIESTVQITASEAKEALSAANLSIRALILKSEDRADDQIERYLRTWTALCAVVGDMDAALQFCDDQAAMGEPVTFCSVEESADGVWPANIAAQLLARNVMPGLHLRSYSIKSLQAALRAGFTWFYPPKLDHSTELRNVVLTVQQVHVKGKKVLRRWGPTQSTERHQLSQMRDVLRILILEDQPMNQLVIERQMARLGLRHDVVENGVLGLKRLDDTAYTMILCDCSMPVMDGYEFTRNVRRREAAAGSARTPIIALTANVFVEDVERCKAAGMDDFIAKPVDLERLTSKILAWSGRPQPPESSLVAAPADAMSPGATLDLQVLPAALGTDDAELLAVAYRLFLSESKKHGEVIRTCAALRVAAELHQIAHGAKGDARNVGAIILGNLLQELELAASSSDWERVDALVVDITAEQCRVTDFIASRELNGATVCSNTEATFANARQ
jgi:signal transduction histidine kinase/PleD family two-component response regulator/HPt (histidine-containing phosphotransfer) domain-containing protein